ncbi:protein phosphatase [Lactonifactor sp. BIOML-A3]|uniref:protein phosphatase n=1 Tax=unclassified Lactonifactor TaxID=2636670 RepID=UPI0012AF88C0|nr:MULTISPECIES: protein phosphatase [unclassified Lactonifactor]MSA01016.1 protein phosphatase [Lactonifactor sp. BIOML-A5]MSA07810.1 protein phosphatase [Lactonifactor sp. BIOML-A4]MSA12006.1 protein phosphatase [Lactonifactor sp. BIOML-A3]MSA16446.1 protein phosphatase [Lactonifactor sp. BIOML-A2]MSA37050.1 protein phosphatase [Lactonifactor sp. BIOML-A1]
MDEEMNTSKLLVEITEENQTRKILEILNECETLEEAKEKIKALRNRKTRSLPEEGGLATAPLAT